MLKLPAFISNKVERNGDNCILTLTTKQAKIAAIVGSILIIAAGGTRHLGHRAPS